MSKKIKAYLEMFAISGIIVVLDQFTKYLVRTNLQLRETWMPWEWLEPYARIIHWKNTGVAFGLFQGRGWLFTLIGLMVVFVILVFFRKTIDSNFYWRLAIAAQLGGAIGNLIDRINPNVGYVVDFIWIGNFPVFNFADMGIVIGAIILIIGTWTADEEAKRTLQDHTAGNPSGNDPSRAENIAINDEITEDQFQNNSEDLKIPELPDFKS
ncbi:signal peptidase II [Flexilinea flocculi]|uniref:signal peptidase II n=1 Tax=Flexilinea flocculi TaxID=1678840 RepID=UPI00191C5AA9|nr:signal peptidase II [Flexilinea flocculi]